MRSSFRDHQCRSQTRQTMATLIQADLGKLGIRGVNVVTLDFGALVRRITETSQYEACLLGVYRHDRGPGRSDERLAEAGPQHAWRPAQKSPATKRPEARIDQLVLAQASEPSRDLAGLSMKCSVFSSSRSR